QPGIEPGSVVTPLALRCCALDRCTTLDQLILSQNPVKKIPDNHEITLRHGSKTEFLKTREFYESYWIFATLDRNDKLKSFIRSLQYSITGDVILVVSGNAQAKVLVNDCYLYICVTVLHHFLLFHGHTAMLNSCCWHPKIKDEFMTCGGGEVETWDSNKKHKMCFKPRSLQGKKVTPTCCTYCRDGTIQIWDRNFNMSLVHTKFHCRQAHAPGIDTSCLTFSYDGITLASRGGEIYQSIWDIPNFKKPLNVATGLSTFFPMRDCSFSPDDKLLVTGMSVKKDEGNGKLVFFDRASSQKVYDIDVTNVGVVRCLWHPKLNPIMVGTGIGLAKVYYDPVKSHRYTELRMFTFVVAGTTVVIFFMTRF
uniref:WD repeat domain 70 n=1 Tax=Hucho hucho TaxID=62062 RepID=A0A4W5LQ20_9TELE